LVEENSERNSTLFRNQTEIQKLRTTLQNVKKKQALDLKMQLNIVAPDLTNLTPRS
jgi:hypothetical protein